MFLVLLLTIILSAGLYAQETATQYTGEVRKQVRKLLKSGTDQLDAGFFDSAKTYFDSVLVLDSVNPDAAFYLAGITLSQGDTTGTLANLKDAVVRSPRSFRLKLFLARLHLALNEPAEALQNAEDVLMIRQLDGEALYLKGSALLMTGDSAMAVEILGKALEVTEAKGKK
jgi:Flp pilus assembly protein TadD